jgi:hypothetical protein
MNAFDKLLLTCETNRGKNFTIYFHKDFDGVASVLALKPLLGLYTSKVSYVEVQYGDILNKPMPQKDNINILVDYAEGFDGLDFHSDHHQLRYEKTEGTIDAFFPGSKSNASTIFLGIKNTLIKYGYKYDLDFKDIAEAADVIDSAGHYEVGISHEEQRSFLNYNMGTPVQKFMTLNKFLLCLKNKKINNKFFIEAFLEKVNTVDPQELLEQAFILAKELTTYNKRWEKYYPVVKKGHILETLRDFQSNGDKYVAKFLEAKDRIKFLDLKEGRKIQILENTDYAYAPMFMTGSYDRYVPFEAFPETKLLINWWRGLGLMQVNCNPKDIDFEDIDLCDVVEKSILEAEEQLGKECVCDMTYFKKLVLEETTGELIPPKVSMLNHLLGKRASDLNGIQLHEIDDEILEDYTFNPWELIKISSGGHKKIANVSNLNSFGYNKVFAAELILERIIDKIKGY